MNNNIIDLATYTEEIRFDSLSKKEQEDYLVCCDEETKKELMQEGAMIPKPIYLVIGESFN